MFASDSFVRGLDRRFGTVRVDLLTSIRGLSPVGRDGNSALVFSAVGCACGCVASALEGVGGLVLRESIKGRGSIRGDGGFSPEFYEKSLAGLFLGQRSMNLPFSFGAMMFS